jgi:hypothetical protein
MNYTRAEKIWLITVVVRSVDTGLVGSNPTRGMGICLLLFCVYIVLCVDNGLAAGLPPVQGGLPTLYMIKKL